MKKYWYVLNIYECPLCFGGHNIRERVFEKPKNYYIYHEYYDYCDV